MLVVWHSEDKAPVWSYVASYGIIGLTTCFAAFRVNTIKVEWSTSRHRPLRLRTAKVDEGQQTHACVAVLLCFSDALRVSAEILTGERTYSLVQRTQDWVPQAAKHVSSF